MTQNELFIILVEFLMMLKLDIVLQKNYVILGDELYKKGVDEILLKCLGESKAYVALAEIHEGIFGSH